MPTWGLVAQVKNPEEHLLAFIAYHLSLGASRIWLYFDDPKDPAFERISRLPRVTAVRCTDWFWAFRGGRRDELIRRQVISARHAQRRCRLDWLGHIDVDEYLYAPRPIAEVLADVPPEVPNLSMEPFEAMHDPNLPDDIFTARQFRGALTGEHEALQPAIFGPMAGVLRKGILSHVLGKSFCRPRAPGVKIALHSIYLNNQPITTPFHPELRLLHFHGQDKAEWLRALPFRLTGGAYFYDAAAGLPGLLAAADEAGLNDFYTEVMTLTPEKSALLEAHGRLITADLGLRPRVADLLAGRLR